MKKYNDADTLAEIVETMCGNINLTGDNEVDVEVLNNRNMFYSVIDILLDDLEQALEDAKYGNQQEKSTIDNYFAHRNKLVEIRDQIYEWLEYKYEI